MAWYFYLAAFSSGLFLANAVPHFVHGVSGNRFPTPFANPPGQGLSSPALNVAWALFNLAAGYLLFRLGRISTCDTLSMISLFLGIASISFFSSWRFATKDKN